MTVSSGAADSRSGTSFERETRVIAFVPTESFEYALIQITHRQALYGTDRGGRKLAP
jgi:hypothetical protein